MNGLAPRSPRISVYKTTGMTGILYKWDGMFAYFNARIISEPDHVRIQFADPNHLYTNVRIRKVI